VDAQGDSRSVTFTGRLYDEATILAVAKAFQEMTSFHSGRPPLAV
jgi:Asp-tRNA(Asn)/Glu-tRNA(Gln) amidotransferase A subunit family amidase